MFKNVRNISFDKLVWMEYSKNLGMYLNETSIEKQLMRNQEITHVQYVSPGRLGIVYYLNTWPVLPAPCINGADRRTLRPQVARHQEANRCLDLSVILLNADVWRMALDDSTPSSGGDTPRWRWRDRFRRKLTWRWFDLGVLLSNAEPLVYFLKEVLRGVYFKKLFFERAKMQNFHLGYGLAAVVGYIPDACHVMKIEERPANVSFTRNNSQVHGADQHESELEPPSCKRTLGLRFFPTIAAHSIEDWKPILVAATFWAVTHCCKYPIWPYA